MSTNKLTFQGIGSLPESGSDGTIDFRPRQKQEGVKLRVHIILNKGDLKDAKMIFLPETKVFIKGRGSVNVSTEGASFVRTFGMDDVTLRGAHKVYARKTGHNVSIRYTTSARVSDVEGNGNMSHIQHHAQMRNVGGNVEIYGVGGNVYVDDVEGNVDVDDVEGNVDVGKVGGYTDVGDVRGDVDVDDVQGDVDVSDTKSAYVKKVEGDVDVGNVEGDVDVCNVEGDVDVCNVEGDVDVCNVEGDVDVIRAEKNFNYSNVTGKVTQDGQILKK